MSHTPGPWRVVKHPDSACCIYSEENGVCYLYHENDANLIAAAPELIAALKGILAKHCIEVDSPIFAACLCDHCEQAREAIRKAEGR